MQDFYWFIIFVAVNSAFLLLLTVNVSRLRIKYKVSWGDGDNKELMKAIRVHCNGTEQVPVYGLIILALCYLNANSLLLAALVIGFTLSRFIHAQGSLAKKPPLRRIGAALTYLSQAAAVVSLVTLVII